MAELSVAILADAQDRVRRRELEGRLSRVECERFPRTVGALAAHRDLSRRRGTDSCVAVIAGFERSHGSTPAIIGHPYRAVVD